MKDYNSKDEENNSSSSELRKLEELRNKRILRVCLMNKNKNNRFV